MVYSRWIWCHSCNISWNLWCILDEFKCHNCNISWISREVWTQTVGITAGKLLLMASVSKYRLVVTALAPFNTNLFHFLILTEIVWYYHLPLNVHIYCLFNTFLKSCMMIIFSIYKSIFICRFKVDNAILHPEISEWYH